MPVKLTLSKGDSWLFEKAKIFQISTEGRREMSFLVSYSYSLDIGVGGVKKTRWVFCVQVGGAKGDL